MSNNQAGKKFYEERSKGNGVYMPWDRLTKMAKEIWNQRAKTAAASKKKTKSKTKTKTPAKEG